MKRKISVVCSAVFAFIGLAALVAPTVTDVVAKQRYP